MLRFFYLFYNLNLVPIYWEILTFIHWFIRIHTFTKLADFKKLFGRWNLLVYSVWIPISRYKYKLKDPQNRELKNWLSGLKKKLYILIPSYYHTWLNVQLIYTILPSTWWNTLQGVQNRYVWKLLIKKTLFIRTSCWKN